MKERKKEIYTRKKERENEKNESNKENKELNV